MTKLSQSEVLQALTAIPLSTAQQVQILIAAGNPPSPSEVESAEPIAGAIPESTIPESAELITALEDKDIIVDKKDQVSLVLEKTSYIKNVTQRRIQRTQADQAPTKERSI